MLSSLAPLEKPSIRAVTGKSNLPGPGGQPPSSPPPPPGLRPVGGGRLRLHPGGTPGVVWDVVGRDPSRYSVRFGLGVVNHFLEGAGQPRVAIAFFCYSYH